MNILRAITSLFRREKPKRKNVEPPAPVTFHEVVVPLEQRDRIKRSFRPEHNEFRLIQGHDGHWATFPSRHLTEADAMGIADVIGDAVREDAGIED